jgi:hypothetical protein
MKLKTAVFNAIPVVALLCAIPHSAAASLKRLPDCQKGEYYNGRAIVLPNLWKVRATPFVSHRGKTSGACMWYAFTVPPGAPDPFLRVSVRIGNTCDLAHYCGTAEFSMWNAIRGWGEGADSTAPQFGGPSGYFSYSWGFNLPGVDLAELQVDDRASIPTPYKVTLNRRPQAIRHMCYRVEGHRVCGRVAVFGY